MKKTYIVAVLMAIALVSFYAVPAFSQSSSASAQVSIKSFSFQPGTVTIAKGGTVTWTNHDSVKHTVKIGGEESPQLGKGQTFAKTFDTPGTFNYACGIHPSMKGTVIVK